MGIWREKVKSEYEIMLMERINRIDGFTYDDIKTVDKYPLEIAQRVLKELLKNACLATNYLPIELGRKKINEINKEWLKQNLVFVTEKCIDYSDEWEYRRLLELVVLTIPELKSEILEKGKKTGNEEIREVVTDFEGENIIEKLRVNSKCSDAVSVEKK